MIQTGPALLASGPSVGWLRLSACAKLKRQLGSAAETLQLNEPSQAGMAELADAADSKSADLRVLGVRLPLPAPALTLAARVQARNLVNRQELHEQAQLTEDNGNIFPQKCPVALYQNAILKI